MTDETIQSTSSTLPHGDLKKWVESKDYQYKHTLATGEIKQVKEDLRSMEGDSSPEKWRAFQRLKRAEANLTKIKHEGPEYQAKINQQIVKLRKRVGNLTPKEIVTRRFAERMKDPGIRVQYDGLYERMLSYLDRPATAPPDPLLELEASFPDTDSYGLPDYMRWQPLKTIAFFEEHSPHAKELIAKMKLTWKNPGQHPPFTITLADTTTILAECPHSDPTKIINHFINVTTTLFGRVGFHEHDDINTPIPHKKFLSYSELDLLFVPHEMQEYDDLLNYTGSLSKWHLGRIFEHRAKKQNWVTEEVFDLLSAIGPVRRVTQVEGGEFSLEEELYLLDDLDVMNNIKTRGHP